MSVQSDTLHADAFAAALARLVGRLRGPHARLQDYRRLSGGASLETWSLMLVEGTTPENLILRRRAGASRAEIVLSLDLATEAALLRAVAKGGVPVPDFVHLCDAEDGLGEAYVVRYVSGEALGRRIVSDTRFDAVRPGLAYRCGEILARIHATQAPEVALDTEHAHSVIDRYEALYRASNLQRPVLELCFRHLRASAPAAARTVLLHGDFRNGNLLIDAERGITAVLDWELAHRGDPAEDLGWLCVNSWRFGRPDRPVGGFGDYSALLDGYAAASDLANDRAAAGGMANDCAAAGGMASDCAAAGGRVPQLARVRYWQAVGSLKWAVMCLGMYNSWAGGQTRSLERPLIGRRISEAEIDLLDLLEEGP